MVTQLSFMQQRLQVAELSLERLDFSSVFHVFGVEEPGRWQRCNGLLLLVVRQRLGQVRAAVADVACCWVVQLMF